MLNNVVSLIILVLVLGTCTAYPQWVHRSKKLLLFPELAIHYKAPVRPQKAMHPTPIEPIELSEDQSKRQVRESKITMPPTPKDKSSISHPCYFSPVQCLLELPEEQLRNILKNQVNVGIGNDANVLKFGKNTDRFMRYDDISKNHPNERFLHFNDNFLI
uniref:Uncharacterized protein n=1 Tax=Panagrellus redivivus TaxID=6233 RepID=A0A7E4W5M6_PANRE